MLIDAASACASLLVALTASLHCAGMCGPLAASALAARAPATGGADFTWRGAASSAALYQLGKLTSYWLLCGLALWAGVALGRWGPWPGRCLSLLAGGLLVTVGLKAALLLPRRAPGRLTAARQPSLGQRLGRGWIRLGASLLALPVPARPILLGAFSGLLPCPLVYAFLARAAVAATPLDAFLTLAALAVGTAPAVGAVAFLGPRLLHGRLSLARGWGLAVVAVGCWTLLRGWESLPCCET